MASGNPFARFALQKTSSSTATPTTEPPCTPRTSTAVAPCKRIKRKRDGTATHAATVATSDGLDTVKTETETESPTPQDDTHRSDLIGTGTANDTRLWLLETLIASRQDGPRAPIDEYGTQACVAVGVQRNTATWRFQLLVAALLSSQTQDAVTFAAMQRLHTQLDQETAEGLTVRAVRGASTEALEVLIKPVGFYRRKAEHVKRVAEMLYTEYSGDIPRAIDQLLALPGLGPKIARVVALLAWNDVSHGLIVDTHVHRLAKRLGWVAHTSRTIKSAEDTRQAIEEWIPREYWRDFSRHVVGFGQTVCVAVYPKCGTCPLAPQCPSAFQYTHPSTLPSASASVSASARRGGKRSATG